jgi:hypothetical protein
MRPFQPYFVSYLLASSAVKKTALSIDPRHAIALAGGRVDIQNNQCVDATEARCTELPVASIDNPRWISASIA